VEPKRKRGRSKSFGEGSGRERHHTRSGSQDDIFYDEDSMEESFSEEDDLSSEEDQSNMISPRGSSSNTSTNTSANGMTPHTFHLNGSNTSTGSNLNHSSPFVSSHSISLSNANSNVQSLTSSGSNIPTLRMRASSINSSSPPDSPNTGDVNDEPQNENDLSDQMQEDSIECDPTRGLNLALLLPFIGNLSSNEEQNNPAPMFVDDEYGYFLESEDLPSQSRSQISMPSNSEGMTLHNKIWNSDLPFFTSAVQSLPKGVSIEDGDSRAQMYIKECWEEFQNRSKYQNMDIELQRVKELWKEILQCLRNLDWSKVQNLLQEAESSPMNQYFGDHIKPSVVFWSSGGRIHHANESFCKLVGYTPAELRAEVTLDANFPPSFGGNKIRAHSFFHPEEMMKIMKRQLEAVQHPEKSSYHMNTRLMSKFRQEIPVSCSILNLRDTLGMSLLTVAIFV